MLRGNLQWMVMTGMLVVGGMAHADRVRAPTGRQIAALTQRTRFVGRKAFSPRAGVRVTPAAVVRPAANGRVVARIGSSVAMSRALPPGAYSVYVARIGGTWRTLLERGGRVAARQATRTVAGGGTSQFRGMCFGWYECHNGVCVCYGIVIKGTPF